MSPNSLTQLFEALARKGLFPDELASLCGVSSRTIRDWRSGKYTIQLHCLELMLDASSLKIGQLETVKLENWWNVSAAGKLGAKRMLELHGTPATTESRRKGGQSSYKKRRYLSDDIFTRKTIIKPTRSVELAEFMGILAGDGSLTSYQVSVALDSLVDSQFADYVSRQFKKLFDVDAVRIYRNDARCVVVVASSSELVLFLKDQGVILGDKIKQGLAVPRWITKDLTYSAAYIRGLFDTDGCIYQEKHFRKSGTYTYPRMAIVSASQNLRQDIFEAFLQLGFNPRLRNNRSVNLERFTDIVKYFMIVGSSNPKHLKRFQKFGGVA